MQVLSFKDWLHFNEGFEDEPYSFHAVFMAGGPASGKTTVAKAMFGGLGFKISSSDAFYEFLAKQKGFNASAEGGSFANHPDHLLATHARSHSVKLAVRQGRMWQNYRHPVVIDVTARDKQGISNIDTVLKEMGYDTFMVLVNTQLHKALHRNSKRGVEGGASTLVPRAAGTQETEDFWYDVQANKEFFKQRFGSNYLEIDNSDDTPIPPPNNHEFRYKQADWHRQAVRLLGPPFKVKNPIGAAMLAKGTNYQAMVQNEPQPQPTFVPPKAKTKLGVA